MMKENSNAAATKGDIQEIKELLSQSHNNLQGRIEKLDHRLDKVDQRLDKVDQRFDKIDQRFEKQDENLEMIARGVAENTLKLNSLEEKIDTLETKEDANLKHKKINKRFDDVLADIKIFKLERRVFDHKIDKHEEKLDDHEERILKVEYSLV